MPGKQESTVAQTQNSTTKPWDITIGPLQDLLGKFTSLGQDANYGANISGAFDAVKTALGNAPNMGADALAGIKKLFGSSTAPQVGLLNQGYGDLQRNIGATARGEELDPYKTPGFADSISRMTGDITDRVKSVYNAAGRDPSGAGSFAGSLGKGLTEGIAPVIQSQFNTNNTNRFNAADALFRGAGTTASGTAGLDQMTLDNILKAVGASGSLPGLYTQNAMQNLALTQGQADAPWSQASKWLQGVLPIAALGSTSTGNSNQTKTQGESTMGNIMSGALGLGSLFAAPAGGTSAAAGIGSALGGLGSSLGSVLPFLGMFSDERLKEDISEVGKLNDGQPVYSYRYKGDPTPRIGLMAQEVEKVRPDAVVEIGGMKAVDYGKATEGARRLGMMHMLEAA